MESPPSTNGNRPRSNSNRPPRDPVVTAALDGLDLPHTADLAVGVHAAVDEGWTIGDLSGWLHRLPTDGVKVRHAFYAAKLAEIPPPPPPPLPVPTAEEEAAARDARAALAAESRRRDLEARSAQIARRRLCPCGIPGGDTDDGHGNTLAECEVCEPPLRMRHLTAGCDDPTCEGNAEAMRTETGRIIVRGATRQREADRAAEVELVRAATVSPTAIAARRVRDETPARRAAP